MTTAPVPAAPLRFLSLELTARCQLTCPSHCYARAGPTRGHGGMTGGDWHRVLDEAAELGTATVQLIGGEPTQHPDFTELVEHALQSGLRVRVYTNLFRVREVHWRLFAHPHLSLACSYYSDDANQHDAITGRRGSHTATRGNLAEALRRRIPVRVAVVDLGGGQRVEQARAELQALGATAVHTSQVRAVGNAARSAAPSASALCGRCADGKAAVLPDGDVAVCEIGRHLTGGNVRTTSLATVLAGDHWARAAASVPRRAAAVCPPDCAPNDDTKCGPDTGGGPCPPADS
ncbi:radical SAM protein [Streptomyces sp. NPDC057654]|uniref:radical SAM protein n=1 Tax=Streptomyces sp. NPDC057654 TaxID=3346196 RepID=UPI0036A1E052